MVLKHKIVVDFARNRYIEVEVTKGSKNMVVLQLYLLENGKKIDVEQIGAISFKAEKPDGNIVFNDVDRVMEDGHVEYVISESIMGVAGKTVCVLQMVDQDGKVLNSFEFYILVQSSLYDEESMVSASDMSGFRAYMIRAENAAKDSEEVKSKINTAYGSMEELLGKLHEIKTEYVGYMDELQEKVEGGAFNGARGQQGENGADAIVTETSGLIAFQIEEGNLVCNYYGDTAPDIRMNEFGELEFGF